MERNLVSACAPENQAIYKSSSWDFTNKIKFVQKRDLLCIYMYLVFRELEEAESEHMLHGCVFAHNVYYKVLWHSLCFVKFQCISFCCNRQLCLAIRKVFAFKLPVLGGRMSNFLLPFVHQDMIMNE